VAPPIRHVAVLMTFDADFAAYAAADVARHIYFLLHYALPCFFHTLLLCYLPLSALLPRSPDVLMFYDAAMLVVGCCHATLMLMSRPSLRLMFI